MRRTWVTLAGLMGGMVVSPLALAIGPDNQTINPTFDGVVRMLYDNNGGGGIGYMNGTGSIVANKNVNGGGMLCVLTADHVVSSTGQAGGALVKDPGIAFGNSFDPTGNSAYMKAAPGQVYRAGANGTSDIAVEGIPYGAFNADYTPLVRNLVPATAFFPFSDIGYGNEGKLVAGGYQNQGTYGIERYLNEKIGVYATQNFTALGYAYEAAEWFVTDPNAANAIKGTGTTYDADSGSPYFTTSTDHNEGNGIDYFTDNEFAVHTGTIPKAGDPAGFKSFGTTNYGDALTQADLNWINTSCNAAAAAAPEPGTICLLGIAGVAVLRRVRR